MVMTVFLQYLSCTQGVFFILRKFQQCVGVVNNKSTSVEHVFKDILIFHVQDKLWAKCYAQRPCQLWFNLWYFSHKHMSVCVMSASSLIIVICKLSQKHPLATLSPAAAGQRLLSEDGEEGVGGEGVLDEWNALRHRRRHLLRSMSGGGDSAASQEAADAPAPTVSEASDARHTDHPPQPPPSRLTRFGRWTRKMCRFLVDVTVWILFVSGSVWSLKQLHDSNFQLDFLPPAWM